MVSVSFDFERPHSLDAAKRLISTPGAVLIAGGQSLVPLLNQRDIEPTLVVDLSRIDELRRITCDADTLRIGAMATLTEIMNDEFVAAFPLLRTGIATTANPPVRNCATLVGNLVRANAFGELSTIAVALDARLIVETATSRRTVQAADCFVGHFRTAVASDEIVTCAEFPKPGSSHHGGGFSEITHRAGIPPMVCAAVSLQADDRGTLSLARVAAGGVAERPVRCPKTEQALLGTSYEAAVMDGVDEGFEPATALLHSSYAIDVLPVVIRRALQQAVSALKASYSKE